jgi:hypothetical protein
MGNAKSRKDKKLADVLTVASGDDDSNSPLAIVKSQDIEFGRRLAQGATGTPKYRSGHDRVEPVA